MWCFFCWYAVWHWLPIRRTHTRFPLLYTSRYCVLLVLLETSASSGQWLLMMRRRRRRRRKGWRASEPCLLLSRRWRVYQRSSPGSDLGGEKKKRGGLSLLSCGLVSVALLLFHTVCQVITWCHVMGCHVICCDALPLSCDIGWLICYNMMWFDLICVMGCGMVFYSCSNVVPLINSLLFCHD